MIAGALAITGCAETGPTAAQIEIQREQELLAQYRTANIACAENISQSASWRALSGKLYTSGQVTVPVPLAILANDNKPTPQEVEYLFDWVSLDAKCRQVAIEASGRISPAYVGVLATYYANRDENLLRLVKRDISWADFARASSYNNQQTDAAQRQVRAQLDAELINAHSVELQQRQEEAAATRQAAASALAQLAYQQQLLNAQRAARVAANRIVTTNCFYLGTMLQCTSY